MKVNKPHINLEISIQAFIFLFSAKSKKNEIVKISNPTPVTI